MRLFLAAAIAASAIVVVGFAPAAAQKKNVCLAVKGEKVEIHNLAAAPVVIDRDRVPDFIATSMVKSVSSGKESKSYNILLTRVKRDAEKAITSFDVEIDEDAYAYPKDSCGK